MEIKKLAITATIVCLMMMHTLAFANHNLRRNHDLAISNQTEYDLTFSVNGRCSRDLGVTHAFSINVVPKVLFNKACKSPYCEVIGFIGQHCSGKSVGGVKYYFDQNAIQVLSGDVNSISVSGSELNIFYTQKL